MKENIYTLFSFLFPYFFILYMWFIIRPEGFWPILIIALITPIVYIIGVIVCLIIFVILDEIFFR
jgi:hypothetical protein